MHGVRLRCPSLSALLRSHSRCSPSPHTHLCRPLLLSLCARWNAAGYSLPLPFFPTLQLRSLALFCLRQLLNGFAHPSDPIHPMSLLCPVTPPSCSGSPGQGITGEPQPAAGIRRHSSVPPPSPSTLLHSLPPSYPFSAGSGRQISRYSSILHAARGVINTPRRAAKVHPLPSSLSH